MSQNNGNITTSMDASTGFGSGNFSYNVGATVPQRAAAIGGPTFGTFYNLQQGAQLGPGPRIVSTDGGTPLNLVPAIVTVLQGPRFFDRFPSAQRMWKTMVEMHATSIDNIDMNYQLDFDDVESGHDGQMASMPKITKRAPISPTLNCTEVGGNSCWNFHYLWLKCISHPDTYASLLSALYGDSMEQWVWSTFSGTWLVVQPDPSGVPGRIIDAHLITNIIPQETGNLGVKRQIGNSEVPKRSFSYKGIWTHSESTRELGRIVYAAQGFHTANLDYALSYDGISANLSGMGQHWWMDRANTEGLVNAPNQVENAQMENSISNSMANEATADTLNDLGLQP